MLRSGARRLSRGAVTAATSPSDNPNIAVPRCRHLVSNSSYLQLSRRTTCSSALTRTAAFSTPDFQSESYFSGSQLSNYSTARHSHQHHTSQLERFLPPLSDVELINTNETHQPLLTALQHLDADLAWRLYGQLGKACRTLPTSVFDLIITLQCRKAVRNTPHNVIDSQLAVRQVCDRILVLCHDRSRSSTASSSRAASPSADGGALSTLSAAVSLRLLYLLVVEEEQVAASKGPHIAKRRNNLSFMLSTLLGNVETQEQIAEQLDYRLRGRLAASMSRVGATHAAYSQLKIVVEQAAQQDDNAFIDPRPFDQLLSALARKANASSRDANLLPSPIDAASLEVNEKDLIVRALRLTLSSQVQASKANIHRCLQALGSATLWWLLPLELDGKHTHDGRSASMLDDRYPLKPKWHPWQSSTYGASISQESIDSFAERVALVLAQRGLLQPALHIVDNLHLQHRGNADRDSHALSRKPDHDFFTVLLEKLAERMASDSGQDARTSSDTHRGLSLDLHLAMKVYTAAHSVGVDLDSRINRSIVKSLASCLATAVKDLGPERSRFTKVKSHIVQRNEQRGSKEALKMYLRQLAVMLFQNDPDLSKATVDFSTQATLLGLHMRTRDYTFSKRLYQLIRLREPDRQLWSSDSQGDSLRAAALHPLAGPDQDTFMWLFAESLRSPARIVFAVQLYFDWLASGNALPPSLNAIFVQGLLRADLLSVVQRVLQQLEGDRTLLTARLARSLVDSFSDAGFPDLAMEMVVSITRATASTLQRCVTDLDRSDGSGEGWRLVSSLKLMSIALDRSSRVASSDFVDLDRRVLRLFEDFRLGLTHHLCMTMLQRADDSPSNDVSGLTLQDVRMAYNASIRTTLSALPPSLGIADSSQHDASSRWDQVRSTCAHVEELFKELQDMVMDPDSDSWNLRLTSILHSCFAAPTAIQRRERMQRAIQVLEQAYGQVFRATGLLRVADHEAHGTQKGAVKPELQDVRDVQVHAAVVAAAIDASRFCGDLASGLHVYELHMRHGHSDTLVEKARLKLLADLAEPHQWRKELDRLLQHSKPAFKEDDVLLKQLQTLSSRAVQRTTASSGAL